MNMEAFEPAHGLQQSSTGGGTTSPTPDESKSGANVTPLKSKSSTTRKLHRYNHDVDVIFDLPGLQLQMKTDHPQKQDPPLASGTLSSIYRCKIVYRTPTWITRGPSKNRTKCGRISPYPYTLTCVSGHLYQFTLSTSPEASCRTLLAVLCSESS